jgi:pyruvate/2-oxoglutarate dehydrogenase complex dihydrolipoamide acyltransferase (E2) component
MSAGLPILLERDNVNDDVVILSQWFVKNGERVEEGTLIAEVETSKANVEVMAPKSGYLKWEFTEKADVPYEAPLGWIFDGPVPAGDLVIASGTGRAAPVAEPKIVAVAAAPRMTQASAAESVPVSAVFSASNGYAQQFSRRARELMREHGLAEDKFAGLALVREDDVLAHLNLSPLRVDRNANGNGQAKAVPAPTSSARSTEVPRLPAKEVALSRMKRSEAQTLAAGTGNAIPSLVSVTCLTRGLRVALQANPIIAGNIGAVIVYEAARLLRKYPAFNATYRPGKMMQYEQVNIGYAMDDGQGLKVAVIEDCDKKSLAEITDELRTLVLAYLENKLTQSQVAGGTFTISDLSGLGVSSFVPLISEDQCAILGIGGEQFLPGSKDGCYTLTLAFDHQLSEGRTAALFLNDLKDRLMSYEASMSSALKEEPACARCGRKASELPDTKSFMVQSAVPPGFLCNLCVAGF